MSNRQCPPAAAPLSVEALCRMGTHPMTPQNKKQKVCEEEAKPTPFQFDKTAFETAIKCSLNECDDNMYWYGSFNCDADNFTEAIFHFLNDNIVVFLAGTASPDSIDKKTVKIYNGMSPGYGDAWEELKEEFPHLPEIHRFAIDWATADWVYRCQDCYTYTSARQCCGLMEMGKLVDFVFYPFPGPKN